MVKTRVTLCSMDLDRYQKLYASKIDVQLNRLLVKWEKSILSISPLFAKLADEFKKANQGGKRIRGVLCILGYEMVGGENLNEVIKVAALIELFQTSILVHDDIIDRSKLRRGKPTLYNALGFDHYALSQSICLADLGFFLTFKLISELDFEVEVKNKVIEMLAGMMYDTGVGEMLDIELPYKKSYQNEVDIQSVMLLKTARYTVSGPLKLGMVLGKANNVELKKLDGYGDNLGIGFQIQDDILGVFGNSQTMGKSNLSDIEEGKATLLSYYAFSKADTDQRAILDMLYGRKGISIDEARLVREIFRNCGALDYASEIAVKYSNSAKNVIPEITKNEKYQKLLEQLADYLVRREN